VEFQHSTACCIVRTPSLFIICPRGTWGWDFVSIKTKSPCSREQGDYNFVRVYMNKKLFAIISILIFTILVVFPACSETTTTPANDATTTPPADEQTDNIGPVVTSTDTEYPLTIIDNLGREITIEKEPERIVSLAPSITETLFALGLDDKIVGVTDYCDYPEEASLKPRVASFTKPNLEKLVSVESDLILAESIHETEVVPSLEELDLTVVVITDTSIEQILNNMLLVGEVTNVNQNARKLVDKLTSRISAVTGPISELPESSLPRIIHIMWDTPLYCTGGNTYINDMLEYAGGKNIYATEFEGPKEVSLEDIVDKNPEIIIITGMGTNGERIYNNIKNEDRLRTTDALINDRIYRISDSNIIERSGPRIVDGIEELAVLMHPEIFSN
jgi:iron complex transport system substrate-binding protein